MRLKVDLLASLYIFDLWVRYAYTSFSKVINIAICFFWWSSREWLSFHPRMQSLNCWKTSESDPIYIVFNLHRIDLKVVHVLLLGLLHPHYPCLYKLWEGVMTYSSRNRSLALLSYLSCSGVGLNGIWGSPKLCIYSSHSKSSNMFISFLMLFMILYLCYMYESKCSTYILSSKNLMTMINNWYNLRCTGSNYRW